jgi:hypothetical protein
LRKRKTMANDTQLLAELIQRLEMDEDRGQMTVLGPDFYRENRHRFARIKKELKMVKPGRFQIAAVDPVTDEYFGNVVEVYDTFISFTPLPEVTDSYKAATAIRGVTQMDVIVVPRGAELKVLKILKPGGR